MRRDVDRPDRHRVELVHVPDGQLVADDRFGRRKVRQQKVLAERRRRPGAGHVGMAAMAVGQRLAGALDDRLAAEHVALHAGRRGVVVDGQRAQHGFGLLLALREVGVPADEVDGLDLRPLHAGLHDRPLAVELVAERPVALLDPAGRAVDPDADRHRAVLARRPRAGSPTAPPHRRPRHRAPSRAHRRRRSGRRARSCRRPRSRGRSGSRSRRRTRRRRSGRPGCRGPAVPTPRWSRPRRCGRSSVVPSSVSRSENHLLSARPCAPPVTTRKWFSPNRITVRSDLKPPLASSTGV